MITVTDLPGLAKHLEATDPHDLKKGDVDLENVQNFPIASSAEAQAGGANNKYMTPLLTKIAIEALTSDEGLANHLKASNPHNITKTTVGLSGVQNYGIATAAEARAGTASSKYMTPVRVKEAITALVDLDGLSNHLNASNPHSITKTTVGLSNVQNYAVASSTEAKAGSRSDRYMTPIRVKEAISALVTGGDDWDVDAVDDGLFGYMRHNASGLTFQWGQTPSMEENRAVKCYYRKPFTTRPFAITTGDLGWTEDNNTDNADELVEIHASVVGKSITATSFIAATVKVRGSNVDGLTMSWTAIGITTSSSAKVSENNRCVFMSNSGLSAYAKGPMYRSNGHIVSPSTTSGGGTGGGGGGGNGCLLPDVKLLLESGKYIEAKDAKVGDRLRTVKFKDMLDSSTNENWADWTTKDISKPINDIVTIKSIRKDSFREFYVINNTLKITQQHEIFTCSDGVWRWSDVRDIAVGDHVLNEQGNKVKVDTLEKFIVNVDTYNLDVEETDTYFAGGYLVHNAEQVKELG